VDLIILQESLPLSANLNHAIIIHLATDYVKHLFGPKVEGEFAKKGLAVITEHFPCTPTERSTLFSGEGKVPVISATRVFKLCTEKEFDASFIASPSVTDNVTILRSFTHVYRIEKITKTS
jgi:hypothetical protein